MLYLCGFDPRWLLREFLTECFVAGGDSSQDKAQDVTFGFVSD